MGSISAQTPSIHHHRTNPISLRSSSPSILAFPAHPSPLLRRRQFCAALKTKQEEGGRIGSIDGGSDDGYTSDLLRKPPVVVEEESINEIVVEEEEEEEEEEREKSEEVWRDWEDKILEDTVPLVGFVRMILHSGTYSNGERLSPEHEKTIIERVLAHHPQCKKKIGCGIDYITTANHPDYEGSRCLFIVRKDGELMDFSYWKCIKGLIKKKYPSYADSFILKHFRARRRD